MTVSTTARTLLAFVLTVGIALPGLAAEELSFRQNVGDFWVYLGVMPAELITGPLSPKAGVTPDRVPVVQDSHHIMVSIFDYRTGRRTTDAIVEARVAGVGFSGMKNALEATTVADAVVYAGLFAMPGRGPFRVDIEFHRPASQRREHATFYFTHPIFASPRTKRQRERNR